MSLACLPPSLTINPFANHTSRRSAMTSGDIRGFNSSSTSGSQSPVSPPTSISSSNTSPATLAMPLSRTHDEGESSKSSPHRQQLEQRPRAGSASSRGGCWTCRVRRKKCDEQRVGDSCQTCLRLKIDCLGWGSKRPEWMRDKHAVEKYKAGIKAKLTNAGMIRGQPRTPASGSVPSHTPLQFQAQGSGRTSQPQIPEEQGVHDYFSQQTQLYQLQNQSGVSTPASSSSAHIGHNPMGGYSPHIGSPSGSQNQRTSIALPDVSFFQNASFAGRTGEAGPSNHMVPSSVVTPSTNPPTQSSVVEQHVFYYFQSVLPVQYVLAANSLANLFSDIIIQEPLGAVTNASCALASLHNKNTRISRGLERSVSHPDQSMANTFYERAFWQLSNAKYVHQKYSESDAIAALHLISFWVFSGGSGDWPVALDIASDWLAQTGMDRSDNPKMVYNSLSEVSKFAAKATMWVEIYSSITFSITPRFLSLYRRLFGGGGGYWARGGLDVQMDGLMGCPDDVMLAIAEVTALAQWKAQERSNGSLSVRELVRRGDAIEAQLREPRVQHEIDQQAGDASLLSFVPSQSSQPSTSTSTPVRTPPVLTSQVGLAIEAQQQIAKIFRETAILYLHTVMSEAIPGVPEIVNSVTTIEQALAALPPSKADRTLLFPIFLAGCMSDVSVQRDVFKHRLEVLDDAVGNTLNARLLLESVWHRRQTQVGVVDWRHVMTDLGLNLLLI